MLPSCANKHATYRHARKGIFARCWKGVLECSTGVLRRPRRRVCFARGNNDNGVPLVLDPHDKTLKDDLWHATFAGSVHIVTATIGHQHRGCCRSHGMLDTGAMLMAATLHALLVPAQACQGNMAHGTQVSGYYALAQHYSCVEHDSQICCQCQTTMEH